MHTHMYLYVCIEMFIHMHMYAYICIYICVCICMHIHIHMYLYVYLWLQECGTVMLAKYGGPDSRAAHTHVPGRSRRAFGQPWRGRAEGLGGPGYCNWLHNSSYNPLVRPLQ